MSIALRQDKSIVVLRNTKNYTKFWQGKFSKVGQVKSLKTVQISYIFINFNQGCVMKGNCGRKTQDLKLKGLESRLY